MRRNARRGAVVLSVLLLGVCLGRWTQLPTVKAAGISRVVHVRVANLGISQEATISQRNLSGTDNGTPIAISCIPGEKQDTDCYVLMLGN